MSTIADFLSFGPGVSLWAFIALCGTSFLTSLIAASLGLGGGVLLLAVMANVFPPATLIPLHGVVQLGSNFGRTVLMARHVLWPYVPGFMLGALLGAALGANLVIALPTGILQLIVALFVLYAVWGPRFGTRSSSKLTFFGVGLAGTFIMMFVGTVGPLLAPFVAAATPDRQEVVGTQAMLMTFMHGFKIVAFGVLGSAFAPYAGLLVAMIGLGFLGTIVGRHILMRIPEKAFRTGFRIILTLLALRLGWTGFSKLFA